MKRIYGAGVKELIERVHKRKVIRRINGINYLCEFPKIDKNRVISDNELKVREKFTRSAKYAMKAIEDVEVKNMYTLRAKTWQSAYNVAVKDCLLAPKITNINTNELPDIYITADDDFVVKRVLVSVFKNKVLQEEGNAVECGYKLWRYTAAKIPELTGVSIVATASDIPGNIARKEVRI